MSNDIYDKYQKIFWEWFDSLDYTTKSRFWYYKGDAAFLYFCNKILPTKMVDIEEKV